MLSLTEHSPRVFDKGQLFFVRLLLNCVVHIITHFYTMNDAVLRLIKILTWWNPHPFCEFSGKMAGLGISA